MLYCSCLGALLTQAWEVLLRAGALNVLYILQTGMYASNFEYIVGPRPVIESFLQPIPTRLFKKCDIGTPECTSVHGISIVVLNKWLKCATKS